MIDTIKTATIGVAGSTFAWTQWAPPFFSSLAAIATLFYMIIKTYKEIKK
jgi:hypothetical protein